MSDCTKLMLEECAQMKACAPHLYNQRWNNSDALCQSEAVRLCGALPAQYDALGQGVNDPVACLAAISGSCTSYLKTMDQLPPACQPKPGTLAQNQGCNVTAQCAAGLACFGDGPTTCSQYCGPIGEAHASCEPTGTPEDDLCDHTNNFYCGYFGTCEAFSYAGLGGTCYYYSQPRCDSGLGCNAPQANNSGTCVVLLDDGAPCTKTMLGGDPQDPCDARLGLTCQPTDLANPSAGSTCQPVYAVPDGATCGLVMDGSVLHNHVCGDYSYCDSSAVCRPRVMQGQACAANGCYPPYTCYMGTCQAPTVTPDPPCTPPTTVPQNQLACGTSPGGLPLICTGLCCTFTPPRSNTCAGCFNANSELSCEDSGQCSAGQKCCLQFPGTGSVSVNGLCVAAASCGTGREICRTDNPNRCSGCTAATSAAAMAMSDWTVFLRAPVGFCSVPTCVAPNDGYGCGANSQCCSNNCDFGNTQHQNLCF